MHFDDALIGWKPNCEVDGSYSARQCRGDKITGRFVRQCHATRKKNIYNFSVDVFVTPKQARKFLAGIGGVNLMI